jgi:superfamily I DNA/RNA helicase
MPRSFRQERIHFWDLREAFVPDVVPSPFVPNVVPSPVRGNLVPRAAASADTDRPVSGFWLDRKQERMARELASPRTLVYGPAGSGKTVFLVARAEYWLDRKPDARILFTCYNASLASYLRRLFAARGFPPDDARLTVRHYHDLCGRFLGLHDIHEQSPDFYAALEPRLLRELSAREEVPGYDCILIDEGQDFTRRMIEVLVRWNAPGGEITLVSDPAQDVYGRWRKDNVAPLRDPAVEHLVDCYRNTAPIFALAMDVLTPETRQEWGLARLEMTRPEDLDRQGPPPVLQKLSGLDALADLLAGLAEEFASRRQPLSDLAVLYSDRHAIRGFAERLRASGWQAAQDPRFLEATEDDEGLGERDVVQGTLHPTSDRDDVPPSERPHFAEALERELRHRGIAVEWTSRDFATKSSYDVVRPRVTVSTVHSAKGMDFHTVVFLGAETLVTRAGRDREKAEALLFTAITRARERLILPYFEATGWVPELAARLADR